MSTIFKPWERAGEPATLAVLPSSAVYSSTAPPSATPFSMRRKSILSGVVHRKIRGVGFVFLRGSVDRLTNIKGLDVLLALKYISDRQREEERAAGAAAAAAAAGGIEAASLGCLLRGFEAFADKAYRPIIPIPLTDRCFQWLYHDAKICEIAGKCWVEGCEHHRSD